MNFMRFELVVAVIYMNLIHEARLYSKWHTRFFTFVELNKAGAFQEK